MPALGSEKLRFGPFEFDPQAGRLSKNGFRIKLQPKSAALLKCLLECPDELVNREQLKEELWPAGTYVDFDLGIKVAIKKLRDALGDSADHPKFIETIPRRGYRFLVPVERLNGISTEGIPANAEPGARSAKQWLWIAGASSAALFLVAAFVGWRSYLSSKAGLNFNARDWVLISSFDNRTGEPLLDGTLEYALERELSNSQYVTVASRERVGDVLRLMRKPPDTKIDAALGREICLRDGGIRALLTGRVEKLGTTYVLSVQLVDPVRGITVASLSEEDPAESQLAAAVRRLSNRVRETLGEKTALVQQSDKSLEKVTTPSLHALQLYTQADELMRVDKQDVAAQLLERALAEDPGFPSAHLLLAYTYANRGMDAKARPEFQRAFDLADTTTDRERFFIIGSYYDMAAKDPQKAVEAYEVLLRLYPDHYWATGNLRLLYGQLFRNEESDQLLLRVADTRPSVLRANVGGVWEKAIREQDPEGARPYLQRASALVAAEGENADPLLATWVKLFPAYEFWIKGNVTQAHAELVQTERTGKALDPGRLGVFYLTFGELREADRHFPNVTNAYHRKVLPALVEWMRGAWHPTKKRSQQVRDDPALGSWASFLMVRTDLRNFIERDVRPPLLSLDPSEAAIIRGQLALARGDIAAGISLLEQSLKATRAWPMDAFFMGSESLAQVYRKQGKLDEAHRILLQASEERARTYDLSTLKMTGALWMRTELQLADLYREMGRVPEAEKVESELRKLLIYADADFPILRELQKRNPVTAAVSSR